MAKKKKCECEAGAPLWMVTYGDLMTLLMTFFVLLLSFSTITEEELFREAMRSFRGAVGFLPKELTTVRINPLPDRQQRPSRASEELIRKHLHISHRNNIQFLDRDLWITVSGEEKPRRVNKEIINMDADFLIKVTTDKDYRPQRM